MTIVYTISTGYSGSTLLSMLMNAHPQVASVGELSNSVGEILKTSPNKAYICSCHNEITQCQFWIQVQKHCRENGVDLDLHDFETQLDLGLGNFVNRAIFGSPVQFTLILSLRDAILGRVPMYKNMINETLDRNLIIARAILETTGKSIFFDASKNARIASKLCKRPEVNFKLVHLVRDPRGVMNSMLKRRPNATAEFVGKYWLRTQLSALSLKSNLPDASYLLVHYESLCSHPSETFQSINRFLDIEDADLIENAMNQEHHLIGNEMRTSQLKNIKLDEAWRNNLNPSQLAKIKQIAGKIGLSLGYEL